jgi:hypothetical protein
VHFHQLLQKVNIRLLHIIPCRLSRIPPWEMVRSTCDLRGATSSLTYCRYFAELRLCVLTGLFFMNLQAVLSYMTTERFPIAYTISIAFSLPNSMLILSSSVYPVPASAYHLNCTGSLSSLQTVTNYSPDNPIVNETCIQLPHLQKSGKSVLFCRVPGWQ